MHQIRHSLSAIRHSPFAIRHSLFVMLALLLVTTWLYAHALGFGLIWDDPLWYGRVVGPSVGELVKPMPDYHFYRPALVLYNRLFLGPDDTLAVPLLHAAQIGFHLLNVALAYALSRRLGLGGWTAVAVAGLVAWYPFSYQAVAWAAPAQPMAAALQTGAFLAYLEACRKQAGHRLAAGLSLLLFLAAIAVQEGAAALAILPLLAEWVIRRRNTSGTGWWLALAYPLIAAGFGLLWLLLPRQTGYTRLAFETPVVSYLLQGFIFPLLGRPGGYGPDQTFAPWALLALAVLTLGVLLVTARRAGRGRQALFGLAWALLGIAPTVAGLRYSYVRLASRLLYYSGPGVALLWACALLPESETGFFPKSSETRFFPKNLVSFPRLRRTAGTVLLCLIALQSSLLLTGFQRLYAAGTTHLAELSQTAQAGEARLLFINFPDRYAPKRPPYPLGYWGVTLAPVSVELGAFPAVTTGLHPETISRSLPWIDAEDREIGPYQIDMRGVITPPDELYQLAHQVDGVYLSRHHADGTFALQWAGAVAPGPSAPALDPASVCRLAIFGETLCLQAAQVDLRSGQLALTLTWLSLSPAQPHDTIFAHLGLVDQPPIAQADGDAWLGMLPLAVWQPGDTIREQRILPFTEETLPERYSLMIGVYNRLTGERLPATTPEGEPLLDNAVVIGHLP